MKIALISAFEASAVDQVLQDLKLGLSRVRPSWTVDLIRVEGRKLESLALEDYDLCHVGYAGYVSGSGYVFGQPITCNVWHVPVHRLQTYRLHFAQAGYNRHVVDDTMTLQLMGQMGFTNVTPIAMAFDPARWPRLNPPAGDFTVGCFGDAFDTKRFEIIQRACALAGVKAYMMVLQVGRKHFMLDPVEDVYSQIHVYAHASFMDTNSRPAMEALACGMPVISTINDGLRRIANEGNISFFDGSVQDLVKTIQIVRDYYDQRRAAAMVTSFPDLDLIATKYAFLFEQVVGEQQ